MKVILLQDVRGTGKKGEVREVPQGYARNFLIARGMAKVATNEAVKELENIKSQKNQHEEELVKKLEEKAREISAKYIEFSLKTDNKGSVFGAVNKEMILSALRKHLTSEDRVEVNLEHPIKDFGEFEIPVSLKKGIEAKIKIKVVPEK